MQDSPRSRELSGVAVWLNRLIGDRLPEQVQDQAACTWLFSGVFWMLIAMSIGMIEAIKLIYPNFLGGVDVLAFGRLRPAHVNTVLFGWLTMAMVGGSLYMIPRLARRHLYLGELALLAAWAYNGITATSIITLALGMTKGKEYEEWIIPLNIGVLICLDIVAACLIATLAERQEEQLYVSSWYLILAYISFNVVYITGNLPSYFGAEDASVNWFYAHNYLGMWLTSGSVATLYYVLPKQLNKEMYAHWLALWGFWLFAAFYIWNGGHHLVYGPVPMVIPMLGIIFALGMTLPVGATIINWTGTFWGEWHQLWRNIPLRFTALGALNYFLTSYEGSLEAIEEINVNQHFGDFTITHAHLGFVGFTTAAAIALIYHVVEIGLNRKMSPFLTSAHWWLFFIGLIIYIVPLQIAGFVEGAAWARGLPFSQVLQSRAPYYWMRAFSGIPLVGGQLLFAWNLIWAFQFPAISKPEPIEEWTPKPIEEAPGGSK